MSNSFKPKVSIVIPVYNGANYVKEAIDSALAQTYENLEIIVVNDGSSDDGKTDEICKSYGDKIRYFLKKNGGVATALNMGIEKMTGEYFSWLSHDDIYYPNKVEKQIEALANLDDKKTIVYSGYEIIDSNGKFLAITDFKKQYGEVNLNKSLFPFIRLIINGCDMLIHKSHFKRVGVFDENRPTTQDYDLWFRILRNTNVIFDNNILIKSRSHSDQGSRTMLKQHIDECNEFWVKVFSSIAEEEMVNLDGSKYDFYKNSYKLFKEATLYNEVISYLEKRYLEQMLLKYKKAETSKKDEIMKQLSNEVYGEERSQYAMKRIFEYKNKERPRILFFTGNWYDRGGINRVISIISSILASEYDVVVCCIKEKGNENGYKLDKNVGFLELEESDFMYIPQLLKLLEVDIFIGSNNCFTPLLNLYKHIEDLGIKTIMWNHESYFEPFYDLGLRESIKARLNVYQEATVVLWLSDLSAIIGRVFNQNVLVMRNPLSIAPTKEMEERKKSLNLISVGRFNSSRKRIDRLIEVFAKILKKKPETKLYIVGPYDLSMQFSESETINQLIKRLDISNDSIIFTGEIAEVEQYYLKASVNVMTSEREGFGLTVLEAAQFGIPSVIFNSSGVAEIINDGVDGFVINEGELDIMATRILTLLNDTLIYKKMSENAYNMAKKYRKEIIGANWRKLIDKVLNANNNELKKFIDNEYCKNNYDSSKHLKDICTLYEGALHNQSQEIIKNFKNSNSWKITKPLRKIKRLSELIRIQGMRITVRNILLKIKEKVLK